MAKKKEMIPIGTICMVVKYSLLDMQPVGTLVKVVAHNPSRTYDHMTEGLTTGDMFSKATSELCSLEGCW